MLLIVGLGNPGPQYTRNRHNVGFMAADAIARRHSFSGFSKRFRGEIAEGTLAGDKVLLLKPMTFMNKSGQSVLALSQFYKIPPESILIVHDELDIAPGEIRIKRGGGHGGHNGLRDLHRVLGEGYARIRVGIGHPGHKAEVLNFVLGKPRAEDRADIEDAINAALKWLPEIISGQWEAPMNALHQRQGGSRGI